MLRYTDTYETHFSQFYLLLFPPILTLLSLSACVFRSIERHASGKKLLFQTHVRVLQILLPMSICVCESSQKPTSLFALTFKFCYVLSSRTKRSPHHFFLLVKKGMLRTFSFQPTEFNLTLDKVFGTCLEFSPLNFIIEWNIRDE